MWDWVTKLNELKHKSCVLVTVTHCTGSTPRAPGAKMIVLPDGSIHGTIGGGHLEELAITDAKNCIEKSITKTVRYPLGAKTGQCCGGVVDLLFEVHGTGSRLYVFGAGHVGQAVCQTMFGTPFSVHVIDERKKWVMSEKIPNEVIRHHGEWDEFAETAFWDDKKTYVVVMTHRHDTDQEIIKYLLKKKTRYIGLIGSQSKWEKFKARLSDRGVSKKDLARVKCPIGIDTGGKAPQEIAISLAAELLQIHYDKI